MDVLGTRANWVPSMTSVVLLRVALISVLELSTSSINFRRSPESPGIAQVRLTCPRGFILCAYCGT